MTAKLDEFESTIAKALIDGFGAINVMLNDPAAASIGYLQDKRRVVHDNAKQKLIETTARLQQFVENPQS
jgi:hypothetical protein